MSDDQMHLTLKRRRRSILISRELLVGAHPFNHGRGGDSKKSEMLLLSESGNENFSERGGGFGEMEASLKIPGSRTLLAGEEAFFARLMRKKSAFGIPKHRSTKRQNVLTNRKGRLL